MKSPQVVRLPVKFEAKKDHVVAIFNARGSTIGLRFNSPEEMLSFFSQMLEKAVLVWPENEWIREYLKG